MKTLFLVRHAKSGKDDPTLRDRDRPLDERGLQDAPKMGQRLAERGVKPEVLISSPARRALNTAQHFADALGLPRAAIVVDERLYESSAELLLAIIRSTPDRHRSVMLFGHNPEISDLAHRLAPEVVQMPTCAVLECGYDLSSWTELGGHPPLRSRLDTPKAADTLVDTLGHDRAD
jgi:phosphohistidine phosphatase